MTGSDLDLLDQFGGILCRLNGEAVSLSWSPELGGFYAVSLIDADTGAAHNGTGDTPSEALTIAATKRDRRRAQLTTLDQFGQAVDA